MNMLCRLFPGFERCKVKNMTFPGGFQQKKKKGDCTTKNIYRHLSSQLQVNLPAQCSRSITPQAHQILQRMWRQRNLLSLIKTFVYGSLEGLLQPEKEPQDTQFTSINIAAPVRQLRCSLILPLHFRPYSMVFCQPSSSH